ncbi:MAG: AMP-binding protein [Myxococcota bacterium]
MSFLPFAHELCRALWIERRASAEDLRQIRDRRLRALILTAKEKSALWRERLEHIDPSLPINLAQIQPITKAELMSRFSDSIAGETLDRAELAAFVQDPGRFGRALRNKYVVATTSGTTGEVGYFVTDREAFARQNGALFARVLRYRLNPTEILRFSFGRRYRMAMAIATSGHFITRLVAGFRPLLTRGLVDVRSFSILSRMEETIHALNRYRPHYLHGYATFVEALAHERSEGRLAIDPEFISLGSEPVSIHARQSIARAFPRAQIVETYGATEALAMANQCSAGRLHVNEDLVILEPVDASGRPVPVGERSDKVYVTNLMNHAQPLLRYEIGDSVTILDDECPCGSPMRSIRVEGRTDDTFYLTDQHGRTGAHPPLLFESLFLGIPGLLQYQLVHETQNHLLARVVVDRHGDQRAVEGAVLGALRSYLEQHRLSSVVEIAVEAVPSLDRTEGHKLRQIYSKVPALR